jgi:hypothetical protein
VRANPYSSGTAALIFVCSITGAVAPSYEVDGIGGRCRGGPDDHGVLTPPYIGRRVGLQRGRLALWIGSLVGYNKSILSYCWHFLAPLLKI